MRQTGIGNADSSKWPSGWLGAVIAEQVYVDFRKSCGEYRKKKLGELLTQIESLTVFRYEKAGEHKAETILELELELKEATLSDRLPITSDVESKFLSAAKCGSFSELEAIIDRYEVAILKSVDSNKMNALHLSAFLGTLKGTTLLIEKHGFDMMDSSNKYGRNAFLLSASGGKTDQMDYFVKSNPEILKSVDSQKKHFFLFRACFSCGNERLFVVPSASFRLS